MPFVAPLSFPGASTSALYEGVLKHHTDGLGRLHFAKLLACAVEDRRTIQE